MSLFRRSKRTAPVPPPVAAPAPEPEPDLTLDPTMGDPDAATLRAALFAADWPAAREVLRGDHDHEDFGFLVGVAAKVQGIEEWLPDTVRADLDDPLPLLLYGSRAINWAWEARTSALAKHVSRDQFRVFHERLRLAEDCLTDVAQRDPGNTAALSGLVTVARGLSLGQEEARRRFDRVLAAEPTHYRAHVQMLQQVCAKWGGSHEAMHRFARSAVAAVPPGSPHGTLVAVAHFENAANFGGEGALSYLRSAEVRASLRAAADASVLHPDYRRRKGWPADHNTFAFVHALAGNQPAAAELFRIIGDRVTEDPWDHLKNGPVASFRRARRAAYAATAAT